MPKLFILIPAFNEATVIRPILRLVKKVSRSLAAEVKIVVINDGSTDKTAAIVKSEKMAIVSHRSNQGYGAAMQTAIEYAKRFGADYALTFDADGQHEAKDIPPVFQALQEGYDIVIGSRFLNPKNKIPFFRRLILQLGNLTTLLFFGIWVSDSQSGFRGFSRRAIEKIHLTSNHMEVSSEFHSEVKRHRLTVKAVPITVHYTPYSLSKGQSNLNSFNVLLKLVYKLFR